MQISKEVLFTLDEKEARYIMHCLDYCAHRLSEHPEAGIHKVAKMEKVDALRLAIRRAL